MNNFRSAAQAEAHWAAWDSWFLLYHREARIGAYTGAGLLDAIWIDHILGVPR